MRSRIALTATSNSVRISADSHPLVDVCMLSSYSVDDDWDNWDFNPFEELVKPIDLDEEARIREAGHVW